MTTIAANLALPNQILAGTLGIENGKIAYIQPGFPDDLSDVLDLRSQYLLPGLIEVHGHMREPGLEYKEDIPHGTRAAVAGGYTMLLDMPNVKPPTTTATRLDQQLQRYHGRAYCDYAINMGVSRDNIDELRTIDPHKISGVKIFMAGHATTPTTIPDLPDLARIFEILGQRGIMAIVHAENQQLVNYFTGQYRDILNRHDAAAWSEARNLSVVLTAVLDAIVLAKQYGVKLYLLHQSTPEEFAAIDFGRQLGVDVYGEVTTVHLAFSTEDYQQYGHRINIAPAIRSRETQQQLWQLLRAGKIDSIVTDHAPHTLEEKNKTSVWEVASGLPGLQESIASLVTGWIKHFGRETLQEGLLCIAQATSTNIARIFNYPQKGSIEIGKDADLVAIDPQSPWHVQPQELFTKNRWSAFEGHILYGRPTLTILRGQIVYQNGQIQGSPQGQHITRQPEGAIY